MSAEGFAGLGIVLATILAAFIGVRYRQFTMSSFKSRVGRTLGSVQVRNSTSLLTTITIHTLGKSQPADWIGLELAFPNRATMGTIPLTLSRDEALSLAKLLSEASALP